MNDVDSLDKGEKSASINRKNNTSSREIRQNVLLKYYLLISFCLCKIALLYKEIWLFISQTISDYFMSSQNISQTQFSNSTGNNIKQNNERPGSSKWTWHLFQLLCSPCLKLGRGFQSCAKVTTRSHLDVVNFAPRA